MNVLLPLSNWNNRIVLTSLELPYLKSNDQNSYKILPGVARIKTIIYSLMETMIYWTKYNLWEYLHCVLFRWIIFTISLMVVVKCTAAALNKNKKNAWLAHLFIRFSRTYIRYCPWQHSCRKSRINRCMTSPNQSNQFRLHNAEFQ